MTDKIYIYTLSNPKTGLIRYVGKTNKPKKRFQKHMDKKSGTTHTKSWVASLKNQGIKPKMSIVEETDKDHWADREKHWIKFFKETGADLTNHTEGGDGCVGFIPSEETRKRMSASAKARGYCRPDWKPSAEQIEKQKETLSEKYKDGIPHLMTDEAIEKSAAAKRGIPSTEETKEKIRLKRADPIITDESNQKRKETMNKHVADNPEKYPGMSSNFHKNEGSYSDAANKSRSQKVSQIWVDRNGMTSDRVDSMVKMSLEGVSYSELGRIFGIDRKTASKTCKRVTEERGLDTIK